MAVADVAGEAEDVAAESGHVAEKAVEPSEPRRGVFYDESDVEHCEECAESDYVAKPCAEVEIAQGNGGGDEACVNGNFDFGEGAPCHACDCYCDAFAGHCHRAAFDFEGYAYAHDGASGQLREGLRREVCRGECVEKAHVEVDECAEYESDE